MKACRLSITNLTAAAILCGALPLLADVSATVIRHPGASLDTSLRNEVEHAKDLATSWLAAQQNADGSWGSETGRVWHTSAAMLALTARTNLYSDACARAAVWLDSHAPAANEHAIAYAWRLIALLSAADDSPSKANLTQRLLRETLPHAPDADAEPLFAHLVWHDALALAGQKTAPIPHDKAAPALRSNAATWPPPPNRPPYCLWIPAHLINRAAEGLLERDGVRLDWRRDIAQNLINALRRDPKGGGYWGKSEGDSRIFQTAFGVLTLMEL